MPAEEDRDPDSQPGRGRDPSTARLAGSLPPHRAQRNPEALLEQEHSSRARARSTPRATSCLQNMHVKNQNEMPIKFAKTTLGINPAYIQRTAMWQRHSTRLFHSAKRGNLFECLAILRAD